jgi:hypothetical protein
MQTTEHQPQIENSFWSALESERALHGTAAEWRNAMGDDFPLFKSAFFQKRRKPSDTIFCHKCYRHHTVVSCYSSSSSTAHALTHSPFPTLDFRPETLDAALIALDPGTDEDFHCPDFPVTRADLEVWELNWTRLARALCQALELDSRLAPLNFVNTFQIGCWSADAIPVILTIQSESRALRLVISELIARLRRKFILLTPTHKNYDAHIQELLANAQAAIFPLNSTVTLGRDGQLQSRVRPGELFARLTPEPGLVEEPALRAFAVIKALDTNTRLRDAPVLTVFRLYCIDSLSVEQSAKKLRCSKATIVNRLRTIREKTGVAPKTLRSYSTQFTHIENSLSDSRARRIDRQAAMDEAGVDQEE